jgi:hypothetical protein
MSNEIDVRIRHEAEDKAVPLTKISYEQTEALIIALHQWGVTVDGDPMPELYGQFVVAADAAYFEIVVSAQ